MANSDKSKDQLVKEFLEGIGAISEMALVFYRSLIGNGATTEEAIKITQAYIAAFLWGRNNV